MASSESTDGGGSRELSKKETREALLAAARVAFAEEGFDDPSLDAICARAGFTRGAFYVHFESRDALVAAVVERALGDFIGGIVAVGDPEHDLETTIDRYAQVVKLLAAHPQDIAGMPFHQVLQACQRSPAVGERFVELLEDAGVRVASAARAGQDRGTVRADLDASHIGTLLLLLALGAATALDANLPFDVAGARTAVLDLLIRGERSR